MQCVKKTMNIMIHSLHVQVTSLNIIELFNSEVSLKLINLAWYSSNQEDNITRYKLTKKGIENFLSKY